MSCASQSRRDTSKMFKFFFIRLLLRASFFLAMLYTYFKDKTILSSFVTDNFFDNLGFHQAVWCFLMLGMLTHLLPKSRLTMCGRKSRPDEYAPPQKYDSDELFRFVQIMNIKAWKVMLVWLLFNSIFAALYLFEIITEAEMLLLTFFYYMCDLICMLIYCPFQSIIMKNRCCVNCRIYDWGHFMMYTPMLFVPSFFGWSLFFTSCIVLIRWEIAYTSHPERFWHGSNTAIRCENCKDRLCHIKHPLREIYTHILPFCNADEWDKY